VDFKLGYIENLKEAGVEDESCDLIVYGDQDNNIDNPVP
jgi:hypothetical protein